MRGYSVMSLKVSERSLEDIYVAMLLFYIMGYNLCCFNAKNGRHRVLHALHRCCYFIINAYKTGDTDTCITSLTLRVKFPLFDCIM